MTNQVLWPLQIEIEVCLCREHEDAQSRSRNVRWYREMDMNQRRVSHSGCSLSSFFRIKSRVLEIQARRISLECLNKSYRLQYINFDKVTNWLFPFNKLNQPCVLFQCTMIMTRTSQPLQPKEPRVGLSKQAKSPSLEQGAYTGKLRWLELPPMVKFYAR